MSRKCLLSYSKDLVVSHVYSYIPYSKELVVSMFLTLSVFKGFGRFHFSWHFSKSKVSWNSKTTKSLEVFKEFGQILGKVGRLEGSSNEGVLSFSKSEQPVGLCLETEETTKSLEYGKCLETGETTKSLEKSLFQGILSFFLFPDTFQKMLNPRIQGIWSFYLFLDTFCTESF